MELRNIGIWRELKKAGSVRESANMDKVKGESGKIAAMETQS